MFRPDSRTNQPCIVAKLSQYDLDMLQIGETNAGLHCATNRIENNFSSRSNAAADYDSPRVDGSDNTGDSNADVKSGLLINIFCNRVAIDSCLTDQFRRNAIEVVITQLGNPRS